MGTRDTNGILSLSCVQHDGVDTSGIKEWLTNSVDATVVENATAAVTWDAGWYVVKGEDVQLAQGAICNGAVRLILADGAKLTATGKEDEGRNSAPAIQVSGEGISFTVYAQSTGDQMGQLIANGKEYTAGIGSGYEQNSSNITINGGKVTATGGQAGGAGIGGGYKGNGSNITINGGIVTATGGTSYSYGGAGIGGGNYGNGENITINGGTVTATGGDKAAGIGSGFNGSADKIFVDKTLVIKADTYANPTTEIATTRMSETDIASELNDKQKRYVTIIEPLLGIKAAAIEEINGKVSGDDNDNVKAIATNAAIAINAANSVEMIDAIKSQALANIASAKAAYNAGDAAGYARGKAEGVEEGKAAGKAEALGEMGEPCTDCPSVEVTGQNDKTVKLYNPESVKFKKE